MAIFQTNEHHADETARRELTSDDVAFLTGLQTELNTQSSMGNSDPVFWVIKGQEPCLCPPEEADTLTVSLDGESFDLTSDDDVFTFLTSDALQNALENLGERTLRAERRESGGVYVDYDGPNIGFDGPLRDRTDVLDFLTETLPSDHACLNLDVAFTKLEPKIYPDTLFLTHAACQVHLKQYAYNYDPSAHAYAMTAQRSPDVTRLWGMLRAVDWSKLILKGAT